MALIILLNLVCLAVAWFWSDAWSLRGRLALTGLLGASWVVPGAIPDAQAATIAFIVSQLLLGIYFAFKLGFAGQRAYGWGA